MGESTSMWANRLRPCRRNDLNVGETTDILPQELNELVRDALYLVWIDIGIEYYLFDQRIVTFLTIII